MEKDNLGGYITMSWPKIATNHVTNMWLNKPCVLVVTKAHDPRI
jgi:hypothetical protein